MTQFWNLCDVSGNRPPPPELDEHFRQIIAGSDPRQRDQSARVLRLVFDSQTSSYFDHIPTVGLAIVVEQGLRADFMGSSVREIDDEEFVLRCRTLAGRLRSQCSSLLELQAGSDINVARGALPAEGVSLINSRVVFMHRLPMSSSAQET